MNNKQEKQIRFAVMAAMLLLMAFMVVDVGIKLSQSMGSDVDLDIVSVNDKQDTEKSKTTKYDELAANLKKQNMFVPPPPKPGPPGAVEGILGQKAFFNGQAYKVNDTVPPGAKIIAIESTYVKLLWEEKEIILAPIKAINPETK